MFKNIYILYILYLYLYKNYNTYFNKYYNSYPLNIIVLGQNVILHFSQKFHEYTFFYKYKSFTAFPQKFCCFNWYNSVTANRNSVFEWTWRNRDKNQVTLRGRERASNLSQNRTGRRNFASDREAPDNLNRTNRGERNSQRRELNGHLACLVISRKRIYPPFQPNPPLENVYYFRNGFRFSRSVGTRRRMQCQFNSKNRFYHPIYSCK